MKLFATFNETGRATAFYSDDLFPDTAEGNRNEKIPADAIEIDSATHRKFFEFPDAWRMVNGEITAYVPPAPTIEETRQSMPSITARQLRLTLVRNGISLASVQTAIDAISDELAREEALIEWESASTFKRNHPLLLSIADALSLTPETVDTMWAAAAAIE